MREVRVDVGARQPALDAPARPVADDAQRAGAVVGAPGDRRGRERSGGEALVGVDVRRVEQRELLQAGELAGEEALERGVVVGEQGRAVVALEREVDVARVALALVELGHERDRHALLVGDLLGAVLVDRVLVGGLQHRPVGEVDLVLAEVALALGRLDAQAGAGHAVADPADQRLHARRAEHRVVDVVEVRGMQVAVAEPCRLVVGVAEDDELQLGRPDGVEAALGEPVELGAQDLARRGDDGRAVAPGQVGHAQGGAIVPRDEPQRLEVGLHREVAVARLPRGHRVALDGVHLDVDGEQVVAGLRAVRNDLVEEVVRGEPLALQAALHVGEAEQDRVEAAGGHRGAQLVEREGSHGRAPYSRKGVAGKPKRGLAPFRLTPAAGFP